jgi:hypothetical protein
MNAPLQFQNRTDSKAGLSAESCRNRQVQNKPACISASPRSIAYDVPRPPANPVDSATRPSVPHLGHDFSQVRILNRSGSMVRRKLMINESGDRFEHEADRVADQVMRMPNPGVPPTTEIVGPGEAQVHRSCRLCEEQPNSSSGDDLLHRKERAAGKTVLPPAPVDERVFSSGGDPLPSEVRNFYEGRFARDFSRVRIHTDPLAERYNDDLRAYAFTFGNHVWMGRGQAVRPSLLLAHELAHVIQQSQPPSLSPAGKETAGPANSLHDPTPTIRRFAPFWEPYDIRSGGANHALVLPAMGAENKIFTEAPVPNADLLSDGFDKKGRADLYKASTTVGLYFIASNTPAELKSNIDLKKDGQAFPHKTSSAPRIDDARWVTGSADAPKSVEIGDLKPSHGTIEALEGTGQLENYRRGFKLAHKEANDPKTRGDGNQWNPFSAEILADLIIPDRFKHPSFDGQSAQKLVLKRNSSKNVVYNPQPPVMGHICVRPDPTNKGIWNYTWVPSTAPKTTDLPPKIKKLGPEIQQKIVDPLTQSPLKPAKKSKPGSPTEKADAKRPAPRLSETTDPVRVIRRKDKAVAPEKDDFDYDKWKSDRKTLATEFQGEKKTQEFKDAEGEILANQAHEAIREKFGLSSLPEVSGGKEPAKTLGKVDFWTGLTAAPFGFFRKVFGTTFVKVAQFFIKMRDKVRDFLKKMKSAARIGSGFLGAALKAAFSGLKMIARFVAGRVIDRLMQSLITGVTNKVKSLIGAEFQDELEQKAAEVDRIRQELERKATETVDALLEKVFGVHIKDLEKLKEVYDIVQDIVSLINLVRWGARVIACLSPPAFGWLWILAEGLLDFAAQKVAETCWFQEKIRPLLTKVKYVTNELPNKLADGIIAKIKSFLPASIQDIFADLETGEVLPGEGEVECDEEDKTQYQESPLHKEIEALYLKIGPERAEALSLLASKMKVPKDRALTADDLAKLGDELSKVDPAKLRQYAEQYPAVPQGVPTSTSDVLDQIEKQGAVGTAGAQPAPPAAAPTTPPPIQGPEEETSKAEKTQPGVEQPPAGKEGVAGPGEGLAVVEARDRSTHKKSQGDIPETKVQVVNVSSDHTFGTQTRIHVIVWWKGDAKVMVRNIEAVVGKRYWYPRTAKSAEEAVALIIPYRVKTGVEIPEVAGGGGIGEGSVINGILFTSAGEKALKSLRQEQAAAAAKK